VVHNREEEKEGEEGGGGARGEEGRVGDLGFCRAGDKRWGAGELWVRAVVRDDVYREDHTSLVERRRQASRGKRKWSGLPKRYGEGGLLGLGERDGPPGERRKRGRWARGERGLDTLGFVFKRKDKGMFYYKKHMKGKIK
jgi:hypothetical protein